MQGVRVLAVLSILLCIGATDAGIVGTPRSHSIHYINAGRDSLTASGDFRYPEHGTDVNIFCFSRAGPPRQFTLTCTKSSMEKYEVEGIMPTLWLYDVSLAYICACVDEEINVEVILNIQVKDYLSMTVNSEPVTTTFEVLYTELSNVLCALETMGDRRLIDLTCSTNDGDSTHVQDYNPYLQFASLTLIMTCNCTDNADLNMSIVIHPVKTVLQVNGVILSNLESVYTIWPHNNSLVVVNCSTENALMNQVTLKCLDVDETVPFSAQTEKRVESSNNGQYCHCLYLNLPFSNGQSFRWNVIPLNLPTNVTIVVVVNGGTSFPVQDGGMLQLTEGTQPEITCQTTGGLPAESEEIDLQCGPHTNTVSSGVSNTLTFSVTPDLYGDNCTCLVKHLAGNITTSFSIQVKVTEAITSFEINSQQGTGEAAAVVEVEANKDTAFYCKIHANNPPTAVDLYRGDSKLQTSGLTTEISGSVPVFGLSHTRRLQCNESGTYRCVAEVTGPAQQSLVLKREMSVNVLCSPSVVDAATISNSQAISISYDDQMIITKILMSAAPEPTQVLVYRLDTQSSSLSSPETAGLETSSSSKSRLDSSRYIWKWNAAVTGEDSMPYQYHGEVVIEMMNLDRDEMKYFEAVVTNDVGDGTIPFTVNITQLLSSQSAISKNMYNAGSGTGLTTDRNLIMMIVGGVMAIVASVLLLYAIIALIVYPSRAFKTRPKQTKNKKSHNPSDQRRTTTTKSPNTQVVMADYPFQGQPALYWHQSAVPGSRHGPF